MRTIVVVCFGLLLLPPPLVAQSELTTLRRNVDSLWVAPDVQATTAALAEQFVGHFLVLVPDLPMADQMLLADAAVTAFEGASIRRYLTAKVASEATPEVVAQLLEMRSVGAQAEVSRLAADHTPSQSLADFVAGLDAEARVRLQLMARLAEVRGAADFEILLDEGLRRSAHQFFLTLGGQTEFEMLSDEVFDATYRQKIVSQALELLYALEPVPDELIESLIGEYRSEPAQWYSDTYLEAMLQAVAAAGQRVASLTQVAEEEPEPEPEVELDPALAGLPCRAEVCGFLVEWQGREPTDFNRRFGASGDLEVRVLERLVATGYQLERGVRDNGLTLRLRARTMIGLCEVMSGTDNTGCTAIDEVRVQFMRSDDDIEVPNDFTVRNRCGGDSAMDVNNLAAVVALRLHYELSGDDRQVPNC